MARHRRPKNKGNAPQAVVNTEADTEVVEYAQRISLEDLLEKVRLYEAAWDDADDSDWSPADALIGNDANYHQDILNIRYIARTVPYAQRAISLAQYYITTAGGPEVTLELKEEPVPKPGEELPEDETIKAAEDCWEKFCENNTWFSHDENIRRLWRDGELHLWRQAEQSKIRYVDPENLRDEQGSHYNAIETSPYDVIDVQSYTITRVNNDMQSKLTQPFLKVAKVDPKDYLHVKVGVDSHEKRGVSKLDGAMKALKLAAQMTENETKLRIAQSSITKITTVQGGTSAVRNILDATKSTSSSPYDNISQTNKMRAGTEQVLGKGTEVKYTHPDNNFSDAGPLINLLIKQIAASTGWSFAQLACDSSEGNLASMTISEGPVAEMVRSERCAYEKHLKKLYRWILEMDGIEVDWDKYEICFEFPQLQSMEPLKQAQIVTSGIMNETMSRSTGRTLMGLDSEYEEAEITKEKSSGLYNAGFNNQMGGLDNAQQSSTQNSAAAGANQNSGNNAQAAS
ncbi:Phage portal protein, lambda family [uncultured Caudovirales phage]|uniref:Phage portal protein, lambda family n=1 Tax=uncultured Caudovirales phage TaxID=2100421 RepID=A0A6J5NT51_9CAUD|nr:Phage portal protein, lambda family [uncultured Caudovirales phage]